MKLKHEYHRKAKNHLVMTWKEIVSEKEYDFSPAFFRALHYAVLLTVWMQSFLY